MPIDPQEQAMRDIKAGRPDPRGGGPGVRTINPVGGVFDVNKHRQKLADEWNEKRNLIQPGTPAVADIPEKKDLFGRVIQKYVPGKPAGLPTLLPGAITGKDLGQGKSHYYLSSAEAAARVAKHGNDFGHEWNNPANEDPQQGPPKDLMNPKVNPNQDWEQNRSTNPDDIHAEAVRAQQRHYEEMRKKHPGFLPPNPMGNYKPDPVLKDVRDKRMIRPDGSFNYEGFVAEGHNTGKRIPTRQEVEAANQVGGRRGAPIQNNGQVGVPNTPQPSDLLTPQQHAQLQQLQAEGNARRQAEGSTRAPDDYTKLSPQEQLNIWRIAHERGKLPKQTSNQGGQVPSQVNPNKDVNDRPIRKPESVNPVTPVPPPKTVKPQTPQAPKDTWENIVVPENPTLGPPPGNTIGGPRPTSKPPVKVNPPKEVERTEPVINKLPTGNTLGGKNPGNIKVNKTPQEQQGPPKNLQTPQVAKPKPPQPPKAAKPEPPTEEIPVGGNYANQGNGRTARFPRAHNLIRPNKDPIFTKPSSSPITTTIKAANTPAPVAQQPKLFPRLGQRLRGR